jgi:Protein of unknown function (DUF1566)/TIR domain
MLVSLRRFPARPNKLSTVGCRLLAFFSLSSPSSMPSKSQIFINYRRDDSQESTVFLSQLLALRYPGKVFFDRDTIQPGRKYLTDIRASLSECGVVIAVIGERWLTLKNSAGELRLHDPEDILRLELKVAIDAGIPIIPVLVGHSHMPTSKDLPEDIRPLAEYQATRIYFDDVSTGVQRLCNSIDARLVEHPRPQPIPLVPVHPDTSPQLVSSATPSPAMPEGQRTRRSSNSARNTPLMVIGAICLVVGLVLAARAYLRARNVDQEQSYVFDTTLGDVMPGVREPTWSRALLGKSSEYPNGLMWTKKTYGELSEEDKRDSLSHLGHAWQAVEWLNKQNYGSYSDWRLPTIEELQTICGSSAVRDIYRPIFQNELSSLYWGSDHGRSATISCYNGEVQYPLEMGGDNPTVRAVRGKFEHK